ncbi:MAG: hypothetical protein KGQ36_00160 [Rickettsiales bacterium]|nr:hypothetical protein [Rickettsiales bacterium]
MKYLLILLLSLGLASCSHKDLAKTLRYADNKPVGVENIRFQELQTMKNGRACSYNLLYILPIFGNSSIITAAENGKVNNVRLIGETGFWTFPFSQVCTVVYGN